MDGRPQLSAHDRDFMRDRLREFWPDEVEIDRYDSLFSKDDGLPIRLYAAKCMARAVHDWRGNRHEIEPSTAMMVIGRLLHDAPSEDMPPLHDAELLSLCKMLSLYRLAVEYGYRTDLRDPVPEAQIALILEDVVEPQFLRDFSKKIELRIQRSISERREAHGDI